MPKQPVPNRLPPRLEAEPFPKRAPAMRSRVYLHAGQASVRLDTFVFWIVVAGLLAIASCFMAF